MPGLGLGLGLSLWNAALRGGGGELVPPAGSVFLLDSDGAYLVDSDGAYLIEVE